MKCLVQVAVACACLSVMPQALSEPSGCAQEPLSQCREHTGPARMNLTRLMSLHLRRADVFAEDVGDPTAADGTGYVLCLYADGVLAGEWLAPAGDAGFRRLPRTGSVAYTSTQNPDRLRYLALSVAAAGRGQLRALARTAPTLPLAIQTDATLQIASRHACWSQTWTLEHVRRDSAKLFQVYSRGFAPR